MYLKKLVILIFIISASFLVMGQNKLSKEMVDVQSYQLYQNGQWDELIIYGNKALQEGIDLNFLRLRLGYAFVMKQQYCEALKHYDIILNKDKFNQIARYYEWFCRINLNQSDFASLNASYFSKEIKKSEKINPFAITSIGVESSYKFTSVSSRGNAFYNAIKVNSRLGWRISMSHNFIGFNQQINEPKLIYVKDSNAIKINQKEYHNLTSINLNNRFQIKASYHYLQTPFNNFIYNNHVGMIGLKYYNHYFNLQANAIIGKLIDSSIQQFEFQSEYYPSGNLNVYGSTTMRATPEPVAFSHCTPKVSSGVAMLGSKGVGTGNTLISRIVELVQPNGVVTTAVIGSTAPGKPFT